MDNIVFISTKNNHNCGTKTNQYSLTFNILNANLQIIANTTFCNTFFFINFFVSLFVDM